MYNYSETNPCAFTPNVKDPQENSLSPLCSDVDYEQWGEYQQQWGECQQQWGEYQQQWGQCKPQWGQQCYGDSPWHPTAPYGNPQSTYYPAMAQPMLYYKPVPQARGDTDPNNQPKIAKYFAKAARWYLQEHAPAGSQEQNKSEVVGFVTWLDKKYEQYVQENLPEKDPNVKQTFDVENKTMQKNDKSTKFILAPKKLSRTLSKSVKPSPDSNPNKDKPKPHNDVITTQKYLNHDPKHKSPNEHKNRDKRVILYDVACQCSKINATASNALIQCEYEEDFSNITWLKLPRFVYCTNLNRITPTNASHKSTKVQEKTSPSRKCGDACFPNSNKSVERTLRSTGATDQQCSIGASYVNDDVQTDDCAIILEKNTFGPRCPLFMSSVCAEKPCYVTIGGLVTGSTGKG